MGMRKRISSSCFDERYQPAISTQQLGTVVDNNPDPYNYHVIQVKTFDRSVVMEVKYPDCTNYEGRKILVFQDTTIADIMNQRVLDPHFSENTQYISPFARFEPTAEGWRVAVWVARSL